MTAFDRTKGELHKKKTKIYISDPSENRWQRKDFSGNKKVTP